MIFLVLVYNFVIFNYNEFSKNTNDNFKLNNYFKINDVELFFGAIANLIVLSSNFDVFLYSNKVFNFIWFIGEI